MLVGGVCETNKTCLFVSESAKSARKEKEKGDLERRNKRIRMLIVVGCYFLAPRVCDVNEIAKSAREKEKCIVVGRW